MNKKMKYVIACATIVSLFVAVSLSAQPIVGDWVLKTIDGNRTDYKYVHFFSEKADYVEGGIAFIYPEGCFSTSPYIYATVELKNLKSNSALQITPLVIKNTSSYVFIKVNKTIDGLLKTSVSQAETGDVKVHVLAFGF